MSLAVICKIFHVRGLNAITTSFFCFLFLMRNRGRALFAFWHIFGRFTEKIKNNNNNCYILQQEYKFRCQSPGYCLPQVQQVQKRQMQSYYYDDAFQKVPRFSKVPRWVHTCLVLDMRSDECSVSIEGRKIDTTIPVSNVYNIYDKMIRMMEGIVEENPSLSASFKLIRKTSSEEYYQSLFPDEMLEV